MVRGNDPTASSNRGLSRRCGLGGDVGSDVSGDSDVVIVGAVPELSTLCRDDDGFEMELELSAVGRPLTGDPLAVT